MLGLPNLEGHADAAMATGSTRARCRTCCCSPVEDELLSEMVEKTLTMDIDAADRADNSCHGWVEHVGDRRRGRRSCAARIRHYDWPEMVKMGCSQDGSGSPALLLMGLTISIGHRGCRQW
ncbi:hypothetical protein ACLOJK_040589 [Asimina triloba]